MSPPGDLRAYDVLTGKLRVAVPHRAASRRVRLRDLAEGRLQVHRRHQHLGRDHRRRRARHRLLPHRLAHLRLLRRRSPGRQPVCQLPARARRAHRQAPVALPERPPRPLGLRQQRRAAADDASRRTARTIDVVAMAGKTGFLYVFDRVTGEPIWPIEERPVPKSDMPGEQSWPTQPFPTNPPPFVKQAFTMDDINPHAIVTREARETFKERLQQRPQHGTVHADRLHRHACTFRAATAGRCSATPRPSRPSGNVYVIGQDNPGMLKLLPPRQTAAGASPGQAVYLRECQACHGPDRAGTENGPTLLTVPGRLDPAGIRAIDHQRQRPDAGVPPPQRRRHGNARQLRLGAAVPAGPRPGRRTGATFPPGPVVASGGAQARAATRTGPRRRAPIRKASSQRRSTSSMRTGRSASMMKPPFTTLTKYDLNTGTIKWQVGLGDDARLAALGITGTGVTQMRSSLIVTAGGLIFAPGRRQQDPRVRHRDRQGAVDGAGRRRNPRRSVDVRDGRPAVSAGGGLRRNSAGRPGAEQSRRQRTCPPATSPSRCPPR